MKVFFLVAVTFGILLSSTPASAQRSASEVRAVSAERAVQGETVEGWYEITSGERAEWVRATTVETRPRGNRITVLVDGRRRFEARSVDIAFGGVYDPNLPRPGSTQQSAQSRGSTSVNIQNLLYDDGSSLTIVIKKTENPNGSTTETTEITQTNPDGSSSSSVKTEVKPAK